MFRITTPSSNHNSIHLTEAGNQSAGSVFLRHACKTVSREARVMLLNEKIKMLSYLNMFNI